MVKHARRNVPSLARPGRNSLAYNASEGFGLSRPRAVLTLSLDAERIADSQLRRGLIESAC